MRTTSTMPHIKYLCEGGLSARSILVSMPVSTGIAHGSAPVHSHSGVSTVNFSDSIGSKPDCGSVTAESSIATDAFAFALDRGLLFDFVFVLVNLDFIFPLHPATYRAACPQGLCTYPM